LCDGFQINVNGNTNLTGAVIASSEQAINTRDANGNPINSLTTQTLTTSNIQNTADYKASAASFSAGVGTNKQADGTLKNAPTASAGMASEDGHANSVTLSGISGGTVSITSPLPLAGEGQGGGLSVANQIAHLNRDVKTQLNTTTDAQGNSTAYKLTPIYTEEIKQQIRAGFDITQARENWKRLST
jgi:filamentous hemagglutinin